MSEKVPQEMQPGKRSQSMHERMWQSGLVGRAKSVQSEVSKSELWKKERETREMPAQVSRNTQSETAVSKEMS